MKPKSLLDIMDRMARRHEVLKKLQERRFPGRVLPDSLDMFIAIDAVLAHLQKQLLDAEAYNTQLALARGANDPMAAIAADMADSARSAFATRLIELRADEDLRCKVAKMLRRARREAANAQQPVKQDTKKKAADSYAMTMFLYNTLWHALQATQHALSLASDFGNAAAPSRAAA